MSVPISEDQRTWVILSTTETFLGRAIRWFTRAPAGASHASVSYYSGKLGQRLVLEASASGYRVLPWAKWKRMDPGKRVWVYAEARISLLKGLQHVAAELGRPYDYRLMLWHALRRWFGRWLRRPWRNPNRWACQEAAIIMLQAAGVGGSFRIDPEATTPDQLRVWLSGCPELEQIEVPL